MKILQYGDPKTLVGRCPNCDTLFTTTKEETKTFKPLFFVTFKVCECPTCRELTVMRERIHDYEQ